jgi:hypothetical protein
MTAAATMRAPESPATTGQWVMRFLAAVIAGLVLRNTVWIVERALVAIRYPWGLDYGEGIVWQQLIDIVSGNGYGPIDRFGGIVYHYPPLYHVATSALARMAGIDMLMAGRTLSFGCTILSAALVMFVVHRGSGWLTGRRCHPAIAAFAAMSMLGFVVVFRWAPMMRVDMLASLMMLLGVALALAAVDRPRLIHAAALCFVAALFTKQTMVAGPAAVFATLLWLRPRIAVAGLATSLASGTVVLAALAIATDGGVLRHLFLYNVNRMEFWRLRYIWPQLEAYLPLLLMAGIGVAAAVRRVRQRRGPAGAEPDAVRLGMLLAWGVTQTLMLGLIAKSGANVNYMIDWFVVTAVFAGLGIAAVVAGAVRVPGGMPVVALLLLAQLLIAPNASFDPRELDGRARDAARLTAIVAHAPGPVISDDMVVLIRAGKRVSWEPSIFAELASVGRYDDRPIIAMIHRGAFGVFVTEGWRGNPDFDSRYNPAVIAAIEQAYPRAEQIGAFVVHRR